MKNLILINILILFIFSCSIGQDKKLTGEKIWEKYLETLGDREKLLSIKNITYKSIAKTSRGEVTGITRIKSPDKHYSEIKFPNNSTSIQILNGDKGILKYDGKIEALPKEGIIRSKLEALIFPELFYKELGFKIKKIGEKNIGNKKCYDIEVVTELDTLNYLIDKNSFELFRKIRKSQFKDIEEIVETIVIDGVRVVKEVKCYIVNPPSTIKHFEYNLNAEIDDKYFELK
jgi:hypothetical protein